MQGLDTPKLCWSKSAQFSYSLSINEKQNRNGQKSKGQKAKKTGGPWHAQIVVHLCGEQGKPSPSHRSEKTVGCDRTIRVHQIAINDVAQAPRISCQREEASSSANGGTYCKKIIRIPAPIGIPAMT